MTVNCPDCGSGDVVESSQWLELHHYFCTTCNKGFNYQWFSHELNASGQGWQLREKILALLPYMEMAKETVENSGLKAIRNIFAHSATQVNSTGGLEIYPLEPECHDTQRNIKNLPVEPFEFTYIFENLWGSRFEDRGLAYDLEHMKQLYARAVDLLLKDDKVTSKYGPKDFEITYLYQCAPFYPKPCLPNAKTHEGYIWVKQP